MNRTRRLHTRGRRAAMVVIAGAMITSSQTTAATAGQAPARAEAPGTIVSSEPSALKLPPDTPTPTEAWKVHYRSTGASGNSNVISGTVIVPRDGRTGPRPLLSYASGTVGMADKCAPSATMPKGEFPDIGTLGGALRRGWGVVVTDYEGLGTPGDHTYMVGRSAGTAVLDAVRAAQRLPEARRAGITTSSPVALMGYSQGGQASATASELADTYAPELDIKGVASGGVPADLRTDDQEDANDEQAGLALMAAIGHDTAYPELDLDSYLTGAGRAYVDELRGGCILENAFASIGKSVAEMTIRNPLESPDWQQRFNEDRIGSHAPKAPVLLYHGTADQIVPFEVGRKLDTDWCAQGGTVKFAALPLADHMAAAVSGVEPALNWLDARFGGLPAQGDCQ